MGNRYEILRKLGQGGMGSVYLARLKGDAGFERIVALKKLSPESLGNADLRSLFEREIRLGARLIHPNIVQVFDAGITGGEPYLATEFVDGSDLEDLLATLKKTGASLPPEVIAFIGSQVCQALAFMVSVTDEAGKPLIQAHRDVSPGNILVSRQGAVKLADFGVARLTVSQTSAAVVRGKWQYFAPEIATQDPDVRADLFALGIVLYQLATKVHPFEASTAQGFYERASTIDPPQPAGIPGELWSIMQRALAKDPALRFQSPDEMGEALERYLFSLGRPTNAAVLSRLVIPLLPPPVPHTRDPGLEQPFAAASASTLGGFEMDPDWQAPSASLGSDGRIIGDLPQRPASSPVALPARPASSSPLQSLAESHLAPATSHLPSVSEVDRLELHERPLVEKPPPEPTPESYRDVGAHRKSRAPLVVGALLLLAAAGGAYYAWMVLPRPDLRQLATGKEPATVLIESEPTGAEVFSGKEQLGQTPLSFANDYPDGQVITLTLRRRGYKPADIGFIGGKPQHIQAKLERAR